MPNPKDPAAREAYRQKMSQIAKARGYGKWCLGRKLSQERRLQISESQKRISSAPEERARRSARAKALGVGKWMAGTKHRPETVEKRARHKRGRSYVEIYGPERALAEALKRQRGNKKRFEGVQLKGEQRPYHGCNARYGHWRRSVFQRDNFACCVCGERGGQLQAHHIKKWSTHVDLRYEVSNGVTVCKGACHKEAAKTRTTGEKSVQDAE